MRLAVTRKTELALRALRALHAAGSRLQVTALASQIGATTAYAPQVMAPLVRAGWVESAPGPHGGYRLVVDLTSLSLLDVMSAVEGMVDGFACPCGAHSPDHHCSLRERWQQARQGLVDALAEIPLDCDIDHAVVEPGPANGAAEKERS